MSNSRVRFGGRTIEVRLFVNTDEVPMLLTQRMSEAAKGSGEEPYLNIAQVRILPQVEADTLWEKAIAQIDSVGKA